MKKLLAIAAIWLFVAGACIAGEREELTLKQELMMWKSRAMQAEMILESQKMQTEFTANAAKLKEMEAKEKKPEKGKK